MNMTGNTILITGGGSGIGRALAEAFHRLGNRVVIAGRRQAALDAVTRATPGITSMTLDIERADAIRAFAARLAQDAPTLNVVIHNAGIMRPERIADAKTDDAEAIVATNLLGPIRLNAALLPLLQRQPRSTVITVSSGLAFVPMTATPTYSATKAAIHSYTQSMREQLKGTTTQVIELAPPYVQTELLGAHQTTDPRAMPLEAFIAEVMQILTTQPDVTEVLVDRVKALRNAEATGTFDKMFGMINAPENQH